MKEGLSRNIGWILHNSAEDVNFKSQLPRLTDEELVFCLRNETRKTALRQLKREAKKRGMKIDE